jgi:hypothetical protein
MSYNEILQNNNTELEEILSAVNELPQGATKYVLTEDDKVEIAQIVRENMNDDNKVTKWYLHTIAWKSKTFTFISNSGTNLPTFDDFHNYYSNNRAIIMNERVDGVLVIYLVTGGPSSLGGNSTFTAHNEDGTIWTLSLEKSEYQGDTVTEL